MSDTIAVAVITALSTLVAGVIASVTSVVIQRGQASRDIERLRIEQAERRADKKRETRREIYVELLNRMEQTGKLVNEGWSNYCHSGDQEVTEVNDAGNSLDSLRDSITIVTLEGPPEVAEAALELRSALRSELIVMINVSARNAESGKRVFQIKDTEADNARAASSAALGRLTHACQHALEDN